jgi:hypothetical protein
MVMNSQVTFQDVAHERISVNLQQLFAARIVGNSTSAGRGSGQFDRVTGGLGISGNPRYVSR